MPTMTISITDAQKAFMSDQINIGRYSGQSDLVRDLIRKEQDRMENTEVVVREALSASGEEANTAQLSREQQIAMAKRRLSQWSGLARHKGLRTALNPELNLEG